MTDREQAIAGWLETHEIQICPPGQAFGLSSIEKTTGAVAMELGRKWTKDEMFKISRVKRVA